MVRDLSSKEAASTTAAQDSPAVLVIDDDPELLRSLVALLEAHRISIVPARDGAEGLNLFRRISPAVVLMDVVIPTRDGIGTIMQMRREQPEVKIIATSGNGHTGPIGVLDIAMKLGADAALRKPFSALELMAMICGMLEPLPSASADPHRLEAS
jgi:DNA-binding response OmpR family regulator